MTLAQQEQGKSKISYCIHETKQVSDVKVLELCRNIAHGNRGYTANSCSDQVGLFSERTRKKLIFVVGLRNQNTKFIPAVIFIYLELEICILLSISPDRLLNNEQFICLCICSACITFLSAPFVRRTLTDTSGPRFSVGRSCGRQQKAGETFKDFSVTLCWQDFSFLFFFFSAGAGSNFHLENLPVSDHLIVSCATVTGA